jgi:bifunctional NMN adenylyltransferase/nudix hydrolase
MKEQKPDVGVLVGRFQVDELHAGHIRLLDAIVKNHSKTIIFLGNSPVKCTTRNPLDFEARKLMIAQVYPKAIIMYIPDMYTDKAWSMRLDSQISDLTGIQSKVRLYGSRDSFISHYTGRYECEELEQISFASGTDRRKKISQKVKGTKDFRMGVIWAVMNQYPKCFPTVDILAVRDSKEGKTMVLLGKRDSEPKYRICGGFVEPRETYEDAAVREFREEAGVEIHDPQYLKSFVVDDWRYRGEVDAITTALFMAQIKSGTPCPGDDIDELKWFELTENLVYEVVNGHKQLIQYVLDKYKPADA